MRFFKICKGFCESTPITIATITAREITRQAIFFFILIGGCLLIFLSLSFTLFAFGEELRMIKEMGISTIMICCLCLASLCATNAISKEREKGTFITLLCKPIDKRSILFGKFLGILGVISFVFFIMGGVLILSLSMKGFIEYHNGFFSSLVDIGCHTLLDLLFAFLQVAIICSIAISGSVFFTMVSNLSFCVFVFVVGNFASFFENALLWYASFFFVFFPNLGYFNTLSAGNTFENIGLSYILLSIVYAILYITLVLTLALDFFDKRECN
ncbi:MAG: hypothetical protein E3K32_04480 [wastewater metagenome]|nr:hypothetical protein [Candidatus Loosdrechtia aerotolerans]